MRELDMLLMRFMDDEYGQASPLQQQAFERLLSLQDPEILDLLTQRAVAQDRHLQDVVVRLLNAN